MFSQQQTQTLKRACSHFEIESPFPETIKRKRFSNDTNNNFSNNNDPNRPLSPTSSLDDENKFYQLKQQLLEQQQQQWRYQNNNMNNNIINNGGSSGTMTPMSTSPSQMEYSNHTSSNIDNAEPYYEIEEYMSNGYENMQYNSNNNNSKTMSMNNQIQYGLYDLTQEEVDMMIMDDTTLTSINPIY
ncbi:hypothetical protein MOUN0_O02278 [Monosporozyma unispora]|nr:TBC1 domain, member 5 [Kazachstania unispora]